MNVEDTSLVFEIGNEVKIETEDVIFKNVTITNIDKETVEVEDSKGNMFDIEISEILEINEQ